MRMEQLQPSEMGRPQDHLPPVIHVAGTNGKGSTVAYLRAFLEAAGQRVHVYTSPQLVDFRERIRLDGTLVTARQLNAALEHCEAVNAGIPITYFEITTAAAIKLFADVPADFLLLEVGLGGRYDATNVVAHPRGAVITPVSIDHVEYLGNTVGIIAKEKAGIIKRGRAAGDRRGRTDDGLASISGNESADKLGVVPVVAGQDYDGYVQDGRMVYQDESGLLDLPLPALRGAHQIDNAALAIAATRHFDLPVNEAQNRRRPAARWCGRHGCSRSWASCRRCCRARTNSGSTAAITRPAAPCWRRRCAIWRPCSTGLWC